MDQAGALMANAVIARHLRIYGRVQGVWYRAWAVETARDLGLTGWVRNRMDGSVEALAQGAAEAVETFIQRAHDGPPNAEVARIDVTDAPAEHRHGFDKRSTC
ncbi:acylphosphatase [Sphingobium sp. CCH11-B1]|jgi:acylphosphatase|uniref:acylphosphatase n=1 Tax=Sphingobium sp. CCH11-B1 TaxID=1768781 RepID=UPI000AF7B019|nr:acylphosphatase [Sphingobium sp. CCH11-B1]MEA3390403.1 acylphosphatase [Pseudomonadota bacterium]